MKYRWQRRSLWRPTGAHPRCSRSAWLPSCSSPPWSAWGPARSWRRPCSSPPSPSLSSTSREIFQITRQLQWQQNYFNYRLNSKTTDRQWEPLSYLSYYILMICLLWCWFLNENTNIREQIENPQMFYGKVNMAFDRKKKVQEYTQTTQSSFSIL